LVFYYPATAKTLVFTIFLPSLTHSYLCFLSHLFKNYRGSVMSAKATIGKTVLILGLVALTGCSDLTPKEQRMITGAAAGTAVGALGTVMMGGCVACGAAIGGVAGTGVGYVMDQIQPSSR
jgi:osmotically inducible lipoprotein OsmB